MTRKVWVVPNSKIVGRGLPGRPLLTSAQLLGRNLAEGRSLILATGQRANVMTDLDDVGHAVRLPQISCGLHHL